MFVKPPIVSASNQDVKYLTQSLEKSKDKNNVEYLIQLFKEFEENKDKNKVIDHLVLLKKDISSTCGQYIQEITEYIKKGGAAIECFDLQGQIQLIAQDSTLECSKHIFEYKKIIERVDDMKKVKKVEHCSVMLEFLDREERALKYKNRFQEAWIKKQLQLKEKIAALPLGTKRRVFKK